jgi:lysyl-tRNA synthetase, class II
METRDDLIKARQDKLQRMIDAGIEAYPYSYERSHRVSDLTENFDQLMAEQKDDPQSEIEGAKTPTVTIAGRLVAKRVMGKAAFAHIHDDTGRIQLYVKRDDINPPEVEDVAKAPYSLFKGAVDLGDWIGVRGYLMVTKTGEKSLHVLEWTLLAKCIRPLPVVKEDAETGKRFHEYSDPDERYRNRAMDLTVNPDEREVFRNRALLIREMRRHLDEANFLEVETPVLQPLYGGGTARPFTTHHNQLKKDLFLRIADELYLKRLVTGGLDRVYEISKDFRNEGVDRSHNPEFTMMECYAAFEDYTFMMDLTERMVSEIAMAIHGTYVLPWGEDTIDFTPPWQRVKFFGALEEKTGVDLTGASAEDVHAMCKKHHVPLPDNAGHGKMLDELFGELVEPTLTRPTFVIDFPLVLSPLAKKHRDDDRLVERFEGYVGGFEICNAFSELNDPADQRARFENQQKARAGGDDEAMPLDEDYLGVMELGMPPMGGLGVGVDRLAMLMSNRQSIRDVILFPLLRDRDQGGTDEL